MTTIATTAGSLATKYRSHFSDNFNISVFDSRPRTLLVYNTGIGYWLDLSPKPTPSVPCHSCLVTKSILFSCFNHGMFLKLQPVDLSLEWIYIKCQFKMHPIAHKMSVE